MILSEKRYPLFRIMLISALRRRRRRRACARYRSAARGGRSRCRAFAKSRFRDLADACERTEDAHGLDRQHQDFLVRRFRELRERLDVFVGNKIVQCRDVALAMASETICVALASASAE